MTKSCIYRISICVAALLLSQKIAAATAQDICAEYKSRLSKQTIALCEEAQLEPTGAKSVTGRDIYFRDITTPLAKTRVLVLGGIHGDELTSAAISFHWVKLAIETSADSTWRFIPLLNPDGVLTTPPTRLNQNKIDLNRNFPTPNWEKESVEYWEQRTKKDPRRWPGVKALSEPESQLVVKEMETFKPDLIVSIHAPYGVLDFDGPSTPPQKLGRLYLDQVGIYPGSLGNYAGVHKGIPVVTVELPSAGYIPKPEEIRQMWIDLLRWKAERIKSKDTSTVASPTKPPAVPETDKPAPPKNGDAKLAGETKLSLWDRLQKLFYK